MVDWFRTIGQKLKKPDMLSENVYNMDETSTQLSVLNSLKVLVRHNDLTQARGAGVKRTMITAIECISADSRALDPLIIWPAAAHRSTWTVHAQPGWHFACSKTGYTDTAISLYWLQHVFDPLTRDRAHGRPRIPINDGFGTHESVEVLQFCFENNIVLCRLPSHTSHKLQPCDVGVFGPLKTAYREQVEQLYRGGANIVDKAHFPLLSSRARQVAFNPLNIKSFWVKAGLFPSNPARFLVDARQHPTSANTTTQTINALVTPLIQQEMLLRAPITTEGLTTACTKLEEDLTSDYPSKAHLLKLVHAAEKAFADRSLLLDENQLLFAQNNEKVIRTSMRSTITGTARVMTYDDIVAAQERKATKSRGKNGGKGKQHSTDVDKSARFGIGDKTTDKDQELRKSEDEIQRSGLQDWCTSFQC